MLVFAVSIFLSAFLLFQVEPMIAKFILPWFGGTPSVWSTVVLFFQIALTAGYAYATWLVGRVRTDRQAWIHLSVIGVALLAMVIAGLNWPSPITPSSEFKQSAVSAPIAYIFFLLTISVGLPFFVLASNGPLMQAWFSHIYPHRSYGPLYSISNVGSLLGLLAYPVLVEPSLVLRSQGWMWAGAFVLFCILTAVLAVRHSRGQPVATETPAETPTAPAAPAQRSAQIVWMALAAIPSIFLLSTTNLISQDVAVIPFLWVLPLTIYLLTFILTFSGGPFYSRRIYALLFLVAAAAVLYSLLNPGEVRIHFQLLFHSVLLFVACMICHAELYALRPSAEGLRN
jgi:MFS family permease